MANTPAENLTFHPSGYRTTDTQGTPISYLEDGNDLCFAIEDDSFWFRHRNDVIVAALRQFPPSGPLFDVGGGNGYVSQGLERAGFPTVLVEPGRAGAANALQRGLRNVVCTTLESAGFPAQSLQAVGLFDVLEHIPDDSAFLANLHRQMTTGGRVYLTVPTFQWLWSSEDEYAGHYRRYTKASLARVLRATGFEVEYLTCFFWFLPLPVLVLRALPTWLGRSGTPSIASARREHAKRSGLTGRLIQQLLACELEAVARRWSLPIGSSCLAIGRSFRKKG
jgi:hypothetical protein